MVSGPADQVPEDAVVSAQPDTVSKKYDAFLDRLNNLHPSLKFMVEHEQNNTLSFLDVCVEKSNDEIVTSIYRKTTFSGQYIVLDSYCSYLSVSAPAPGKPSNPPGWAALGPG